MTDFNQTYRRYQSAFERALDSACERMCFRPAVLTESMRYSLQLKGKRVRPVLFFAALEALGLDYESEHALAVAIETIHTYSLIHDDLPAMDNDDFRRGKPSSHKQFGEANAILAGDALLSYAFDLLLREGGRSPRHLEAGRLLSACAGPDGMIAGQSADLKYTGKAGGEEELQFIYAHKTGKLITAPVEMAAVLAGCFRSELHTYGENLGALFQLTDDILDEKGTWDAMGKTLGKDRAEDKLTGVKVYGMERAETLADEYAARCREAIAPLCSDFLNGMVTLVRTRTN